MGTLIPNCRNVAFEGLNHWLYLEDPARFNELVGQFALEYSASRARGARGGAGPGSAGLSATSR